jgi:hypothetical protein
VEAGIQIPYPLYPFRVNPFPWQGKGRKKRGRDPSPTPRFSKGVHKPEGRQPLSILSPPKQEIFFTMFKPVWRGGSEWGSFFAFSGKGDKLTFIKQEHVCYYHPQKGVGKMNLLKYAVKKERWDLAAHAIILAAVRVLNQGVKWDDRETKTKKGRAKR